MAGTDAISGVFLDLAPRTKLRVTGADRARYLNGQLTNDLKKANESTAIASCLLNAKGKIENFILVSVAGDSFVIDAERDLEGKLAARLERYVIADDVQVEDVSSQFSIFHVFGVAVPELPKKCRIVSAKRFPTPGHDIWVENAGREYVFGMLNDRLKFWDDPTAEIFRIETGTPRWGRELTDEIMPVEADLEADAVDYEKGCYVGQEVVSRMKMSGQRNKKLSGFISVDERPLEPGMKLYGIGEEKEVGWITSAVHSRRLGKAIALGFLKRPFFHAGYRLDAINPENPLASGAVRAEVADLPFLTQWK